MLARIDALLCRTALRWPQNRRRDIIGGYAFDATHVRVTFNAQTVALTPKEFRFALLLLSKLSRPVLHAHILEVVWTRRRDVRSRTLNTRASRIRTELQLRPEHGYCLTPAYGYGYQLDCVLPEAVVDAR